MSTSHATCASSRAISHGFWTQDAQQPERRRARVVGDERHAAHAGEQLLVERLRARVLRRENDVAARAPGNEQRRPRIAIRVAEDGELPFQRQAGALAEFLPRGGGGGGGLGKERAPGVRLRLEGKQPPEVRALGFFQGPAHDLGHELHVAPGDGAIMRELQRQAGFRAQVLTQGGKSVAHGVQVGLALDPVDG